MLKVDEVDGMECMENDGPTRHHGESKSKVAQKNNASLNNGNKGQNKRKCSQDK
jgi:hypothetical protein